MTLAGLGKSPVNTTIVSSENWYDGKHESITLLASKDIHLFNLTVKNNYNEPKALASGVEKVHTVAAVYKARVVAEDVIFLVTQTH